jgi:hypothetical protein
MWFWLPSEYSYFFDLPERKNAQVSRSNAEAYIRQNELNNKLEPLIKHELNELKKYLTRYVTAWDILCLCLCLLVSLRKIHFSIAAW